MRKLYRVTCRGMTCSLGNDMTHGIGYVVADNPDEAYQKMRDSLEKRSLGFSTDREMDKIELLAEDDDYTDCGVQLYV